MTTAIFAKSLEKPSTINVAYLQEPKVAQHKSDNWEFLENAYVLELCA
jgi:hypothetical protein